MDRNTHKGGQGEQTLRIKYGVPGMPEAPECRKEYHFNRGIMQEAWKNPHDFSIGWLIVMAYLTVSFLYLIFKIRSESKQG